MNRYVFFVLSLIIWPSILLGATVDLNHSGEVKVYQVVDRYCEKGEINEQKGIKVGTTVTRDFFYVDGRDINTLLDEAGTNVIELPYKVSGEANSICANRGIPTRLILFVKNIK